MTSPSAAALKTAAAEADRTVVTGVILMICFSLFAPLIDVFAKLATAEMPAAQIAFARFACQTLLLAPVAALRGGFTRLSPREAAMHGARGALIAAATILFFSALKYMPIADAMAIFFVEPMILTLLGGLLLGEAIGWRRYAACAVGFGGALIVIQPSFAEVGWPSVLPIGTALCFAFYLILTRHLAQRGDAVAMQVYAGISGAVILGIALWLADGTGLPAFDPVRPTRYGMMLVIGVGVAATVAHIFIAFAFQKAPASVLAPLQYLEIVTATLAGYLVFGDFPEPVKWIGIAIIVASGLFIFARERRAARR